MASESATGAQTVSPSNTASAKRPSETSAKPASKRQTATRSKPSQSASSKKSVPLDRGTATENAAFVDQGASRTKTFPKFVPPVAATTQMDAAEKKVFEKQMAERMKQQEQSSAQEKETSEARQQRIKLLNALAAKHSKETIDEIRK